MKAYYSPSRRVFLVFNYLVLILLALTMIVPMINVIAVSFTTDLESYDTTLKLFPKQPSVTGYVQLFRHVSILRPFLNNVFVTVIGTSLHLLLCSMAGFVLVRNNLWGKAILVGLVTLPMMIPFQMIIIPVYVTIRNLGLIDTLWSLILIGMVSTFSIILMKNYFEGIPKSLEESAYMDGASEFTVFFRIFLPLAKPGIATITIFEFVSRWNHFLPAVLFINSPKNYTLQIALRSLVVSQELTSSTQSVANNTRMAGIVISVIPLIVVYVFAQKYFIKGLMVGSVKE